jgi:hypothetical protein
VLGSGIGWAGESRLHQAAFPPPTRSLALPLSFEENQGQVDEQVRYLARGTGYTLFLTPDAAVLGLRAGDRQTHWLRLMLQKTAAASVAGEGRLQGKSNYMVGNDPTLWRKDIPNFSSVRYRRIYPGIDLTFYGRAGQLENDFELDAGADPNTIAWQLEGADHVRVDASGDLVITVGGNEVRLRQPRAYQQNYGEERDVRVRYRVRGQKVGFALGKYNHRQALIIDPSLTYSTYLGGTGGDSAMGVAVDSSGDAYVAGVTASINFPFTGSAYEQTYQGDGDVFVAEFNPQGSGLIFSTYLGGSGVDTPSQIVLDASNDIFLVGSTTSNNFPVTSGVFQPLYDGDQDAFLTEMNPAGSALLLSTYIGGSGADFGTALALDSSGNIYVTGSTQSTDYPTQNPIQIANSGLYDAFVTEISPSGALLYSTYLGGSLADYGTGIAVDSSQNVYVSGYTYSTNFPTQSAYQGALSGGSDIFVTKFTPGSSALLFSTYLGGSSLDKSTGMFVDSSGNIYLTGSTQSPNFPVSAGAYQTSLLGTQNAFLTKVASDASVLVFSTVFGGSVTDQANGMALDAAGNIYITGFTQSDNFPLLDPFQNILGLYGAGNCGSTNLVNVPNPICSDAFIAKFAPSGIPVYSSLLGGSGIDSGQGIAVDSTGAAYVAGQTYSPNFPATYGAFQPLFQGTSTNSNAFVTKVISPDGPSVVLTPQEIDFGNQPLQIATTPVTVTLTNEGSAALSISSISSSGDFRQTNTCGSSLAGGGATCTIQIIFTPTSVGLQTVQITINDNAGLSGASATQGITVTGRGILSGGSLIFTPSKLTFSAQTINTTSGNQSALLVNNGNQAITITNITTAGPFSQTNNCGPNFPTVPASLNVSQSCTIAVSFTPTSTGSQTGSVEVSSNAVNGVTSVQLSGVGSPIYSLSSNQRSSVLLIGTTSTTFTISASGPSTFLGSIALACGSGATCTFSPSSISAGQSSTLAVTGLSATTANPLNFTVTGTSSGQTATIALAIFFADYTLSATPSGTSVTAGNNATYTINATPTNGFSQTVLLSCSGIPPGTTCYWNPPALIPTGVTGSTVSGTLTITTEAESRLAPPLRLPGIPPGLGRWVVLLGLLTLLAASVLGLGRTSVRMHTHKVLALLLAAIALVIFGVSCENYVNPINITPHVNGTPSGTYAVTVTGTLGTGTGVVRATTVNLSVLPNT